MVVTSRQFRAISVQGVHPIQDLPPRLGPQTLHAGGWNLANHFPLLASINSANRSIASRRVNDLRQTSPMSRLALRESKGIARAADPGRSSSPNAKAGTKVQPNPAPTKCRNVSRLVAR